MNSNERRLIQDLFDRLATVENQNRDAEAERLIAEGMRRVPHAPYAMAQTIIAQNQALEDAARRIEALEGGMGGYEGSGAAAPGAMGAPDLGPRGSVPSAGRGAERGGGGFLANAGQVALGVAGGMMLGEVAKSLLGSGSEAQAAPQTADAPVEQAGADNFPGADTAASGAEGGGGGLFDWLFGGGDAANDSGDWDDGGGDWGE